MKKETLKNRAKTWADLKHGDVIKDAIGDTYTIIDILPHSALLSSESSVPYWCELSKIQHAGWQIVQPEEEYRKELEKAQFCDPRI